MKIRRFFSVFFLLALILASLAAPASASEILEVMDVEAKAALLADPETDEVLYAEVLNHRMRLLTRAGEFLLRMTVEELKPMLPKDGRFYECHRGIVINLDAVGTLEAQVVVMENGDRLPVSRRRRPSLEQAYAERSIARVRSEL